MQRYVSYVTREHAKKWTLEKFFPRFGVLVLKSSSLLADFASHGFSFPQKIREKQGLPVLHTFKVYNL